MIKTLPNPEYLRELLRRIKGARKKIVGVNYLANLDVTDNAKYLRSDPVGKLGRALIQAKKRGVDVSIILEGSKFTQNYPFYKMLKEKGADVWLDTSKTFIHQKAVLIDNRYLFVGSHNWSRTALTTNEEVSVLVDGPSAIRRFLSEFKKISAQRKLIRKRTKTKKIDIPKSFIDEFMPKLFRAHTLLAFRLYLIFLGEDKGTYSAIPIDEKKWGIKLGFSLKKARKNLSKNYKRYFYKRRLKGLLEILRNKYKIIRIDRDADVVSRMRLPQSTMKISIPDTFWEHGWYLRLSLPAIYFYFISLLELQNSPFYPWWSLSLKKVGRRYRCVPTVLANGVRELADYNILEILKDIPVKRGNRYTQEAGYYRLNPFYDVKGFEKDILKLQKKFSKRVVRLSREFAAILYASHNLETLHFICGLIKSRGERKVREAFKIISKTKISSSKRRLDYLMILMEREG